MRSLPPENQNWSRNPDRAKAYLDRTVRTTDGVRGEVKKAVVVNGKVEMIIELPCGTVLFTDSEHATIVRDPTES